MILIVVTPLEVLAEALVAEAEVLVGEELVGVGNG